MKRIEPRFSLHALRQHIRARLRRLPENSRALMAAVLLGDRDANLSEDFRQWGISHILAVSGWHVGLALFAACFLFGCGRFSIPFCGLFLCGYCLVSGASMSAVRATIIIEIGLLGVFFGRSAVALNSVGVAGVLMLVFNPWAYYDLGWQLSLLAAVVVTSLQKNSLWLASAAAGPMMWIVTSPMIAPIAKGIYFSSLPINIMASGVFTVLLAVVFLGSLPVLFLGTGTVFALPGELLLRFWGAVADQWVEWLPQALPVNYFPLWFCSGTIFFLVARGLKLKLWRCLALAVVGAFIAAIFFFRPD